MLNKNKYFLMKMYWEIIYFSIFHLLFLLEDLMLHWLHLQETFNIIASLELSLFSSIFPLNKIKPTNIKHFHCLNWQNHLINLRLYRSPSRFPYFLIFYDLCFGFVMYQYLISSSRESILQLHLRDQFKSLFQNILSLSSNFCQPHLRTNIL